MNAGKRYLKPVCEEVISMKRQKKREYRSQKKSDLYEYQRKILVHQLYRLIDELEGRADQPRYTNGFPFNLLEKAIHMGLTGLENMVGGWVDGALKKLRRG
jgi:hypothetical protein